MGRTPIILAALWIVVMLLYLLGGVLRIGSGDWARGLAEMSIKQLGWLGFAVLMSIPIVMIFLTLALPQPISRWTNIVVACLFFLLNLIGLPTYHSWYDRYLLAVSTAFNVASVWYAWNWG